MRIAGRATGMEAVEPPEQRISDLLADLEVSIEQFDERLAACDPGPAPTVGAPRLGCGSRNGPAYPTIDPDAIRVLQPSEHAPPHAPVQGAPATDLLTQLASAANRKSAEHVRAALSDQRTRSRLDAGLRRIFDYLHQFSQHVDVLQPAMPANYALSPDLAFREVVWQTSTIDYRSELHAGQTLFHTVVMRVRLRANGPLVLSCPGGRLDALKKELAFLNVVIMEEGRQRPAQPVSLTLSPDIATQLHFVADLKTNEIVLRTRNLGGLGLHAFRIDPDRLDQTLLDDLGLCVLGRQQGWPAALKSIPFKPLT